MSREIFFIADDFGLHADVNAAIVTGHVNGALTGASLMMGQPGTSAAIALAHQHPTLDIGWHVHLCNSHPLTVSDWPWDRSPNRAGWALGLSAKARELMRSEIAAQWESFSKTDLPCVFVNVHHHLHAHPLVYRELLRILPRTWSGWLRQGVVRYFSPTLPQQLIGSVVNTFGRLRRRKCPFTCSETLWGIDRLHRMQSNEIKRTLSRLPKGRHEFMFHPRSLENDRDLACLIELRCSDMQTRQW